MSTPKRAQLFNSINRQVRLMIAGAILFNQKTADRLGLNATDLQCLNLLEMQGQATPGDLARWSHLTTGGITVALDRLEKGGYVRRSPNPVDRRSSIIRTVPGARRRVNAIYRSKGDALAKALSVYNADQLHLILDFLERTNRAAEESGR